MVIQQFCCHFLNHWGQHQFGIKKSEQTYCQQIRKQFKRCQNTLTGRYTSTGLISIHFKISSHLHWQNLKLAPLVPQPPFPLHPTPTRKAWLYARKYLTTFTPHLCRCKPSVQSHHFLFFMQTFFLTLYNSFDLQIASAEQSPLAQVRFSLDRPKEVQNGYCGFFF